MSTTRQDGAKKTSAAPPPAGEKWDCEKVVKEFGPIKRIDRPRESQLLKEGKWQYILTITVEDVGYWDLPKKDRPTGAELKERGDTRNNFSIGMHFGEVGHRLVNMQEMYETAKPMPEDLTLSDDDIWFGENGLPCT